VHVIVYIVQEATPKMEFGRICFGLYTYVGKRRSYMGL